jgi:hypothetical protein
MRTLARIVFCFASLIFMPLPAEADPLATMDQVGAAILSCWKPPAGAEKSTVTLSFSLKSDGTLIGPPQPTFIDVPGDESVRQQFVASAIDAVDRCTPVTLAPDLAEGIGGQVFTLEFSSADRVQDISPAN